MSPKYPNEAEFNILDERIENSSVVNVQTLEHLQPHWPLQPLWTYQPLQPYIIKELSDPDGCIIPGTKMTNTGPFLWNGSSKIQFFTDIWYLLCQRLLRPAYVTFLGFS